MKMRSRNKRSGVAMLVVLLIVFAIAILSFGFLERSDMELACGANSPLRVEMDYLADSALQHAKAVILSPQNTDTSSGYFQGVSAFQIDSSSNDYYDLKINPVASGYAPKCTYDIACTAYRLDGSDRLAQSSFSARLRLDPCIAYYQQKSQAIPAGVTINGDMYCNENITVQGRANGDVYSFGAISTVSMAGHAYAGYSCPVDLPGIVTDDFKTDYWIGTSHYLVGVLGSDTLENRSLGPTAGNPAGIYYRSGTLKIKGNVAVNGTLVIKDDLNIEDNGNLTVTAVKNFPALIVGHDFDVNKIAISVTTNGYVQVTGKIDMKNKVNGHITVNGVLCVLGEGVQNIDVTSSLVINADPFKAALQIWPTSGNAKKFSPAADAFFKFVKRP